MSAIDRLRTLAPQLATDEQDDAYIEATREYHSKEARRAREDWLLQDISVRVRRTNIIRAKLRFAVEERLSAGFLKRRLAAETATIELYRAELHRLMGVV